MHKSCQAHSIQMASSLILNTCSTIAYREVIIFEHLTNDKGSPLNYPIFFCGTNSRAVF